MTLPTSVKLVEVGPRDGLQNESAALTLADKVSFIQLLADAGLSVIEAGSFVSANKVPQMANTAQVLAQLNLTGLVHYPVIAMNERGAVDAIAAGAKQLAFVFSVSETFTQKNMGVSLTDNFHRFEAILKLAEAHQVSVRIYFSCVFGCPYEGKIALKKTSQLATQVYQCYPGEISLGDTIGVASPTAVTDMITLLSATIPLAKIAVHFHDTYGQALVNIYAALLAGVNIIDCSTAGLGGCPYAPGASGNVATEEVVYLLNNLSITHGVDLSSLLKASQFICQRLGKSPHSKVAQALPPGIH